MNKLSLLTGALIMGFAGSALAQTCDTALPILSDSSVAGDTCASTNSLPSYGGTVSPQNEIVYSFTAQDANAALTINLNGLPGGAVYLMPAPCASSTDPTNFGFDGTPMTIAPDSLTDGQEYFVIVTADPGGPADACGAFSVDVAGQLPVELQNFSVE
jgi:hypothetical protein